jgi:hypothetical protein
MGSGAPYINIATLELRVPFSKESVYIRSIPAILWYAGARIGAIELINKNNGVFTQDDQSLIEMMLNPLAIAPDQDMFEDANVLRSRTT